MGATLFDHYTYLHFAVGIVAYYWNVSLSLLTTLHIIFEWIENTSGGIWFINRYLTMWPGGKPSADSITNSIGDTIGAICGWLSAYVLSSRISSR